MLPNNFPQKDYGRGFPMKWSYDPLSRKAHYNEDSPYMRTYSPPELWVFDNMGLTVDIVVGIFVVALALGVNEIWQTTCGNRSPAIPPNTGSEEVERSTAVVLPSPRSRGEGGESSQPGEGRRLTRCVQLGPSPQPSPREARGEGDHSSLRSAKRLCNRL